jgi:hypothetical protein
MSDRADAPDSLLDGAALARRLHVGVGTVDDLRRAGRIPFVRIGPKTVRYDFREVVAALREATGAGRQERGA